MRRDFMVLMRECKDIGREPVSPHPPSNHSLWSRHCSRVGFNGDFIQEQILVIQNDTEKKIVGHRGNNREKYIRNAQISLKFCKVCVLRDFGAVELVQKSPK